MPFLHSQRLGQCRGRRLFGPQAKGNLNHQIFHEAIRSRPWPSNISRSHSLPTSTIKYFTKSFAPFNYCCHLKQHAKSWATYQALSNQEKKEYFKSKVKRINILHQHKDLTTDSIEFVILTDIVKMIIGDNSFTMTNSCSMLATVMMTLWRLRQSRKGPPRSPRKRSMPWSYSSNNPTSRCTRSQSRMSCILN